MSKNLPELLTKSETCEKLRVSPDTLDRMISRGDIQPSRIKGVRRVVFDAAVVASAIVPSTQ